MNNIKKQHLMIHFKWKIKIKYDEYYNIDETMKEFQSRSYPLFTSDEMFIQNITEIWVRIPLAPIKELVITYEQ